MVATIAPRTVLLYRVATVACGCELVVGVVRRFGVHSRGVAQAQATSMPAPCLCLRAAVATSVFRANVLEEVE